MTTYVQNRKAHFNFSIEDTIETGIELYGFEVKAIKAGKGNLAGAFGIVRGGEIYIVNMNVPPYQTENTPKDYDPDRPRRLLLSKKEITELSVLDKRGGLTLIPTSLYSKGRRIKVALAVAKGKKLFDKRESIKKRDTDRDIRRTLKE